MAQIEDNAAQDAGSPDRQTATPITAHPLFPALVALWFAALMGLGMLVLPGSLLERIVAASHIGAILPAANPPLGFTARVLIALVAAGSGAAAGLWLARKLAGLNPETQARRIAADDQAAGNIGAYRRPLFASQDLAPHDAGDAGEADQEDRAALQDMTGQPVRSRRVLAMPEPARKADDFNAELFAVPLPGTYPQQAPDRDTAVVPPHAGVAAPLADTDPQDAPIEEAPWQVGQHEEDAVAVPAAHEGEKEPVRDRAEPDTPRHGVAAADLADLGIFGLVERLRIALENRARPQANMPSEAPSRNPDAGLLAVSGAPIAPDGGLQSFFAPTPTPPQAVMDHPVSAHDGWNPVRNFPQLAGLNGYGAETGTAEDEDEEEEAAQARDEGFASLLDRPAPHARPPEALERQDNTDRALREALATLRQISGAA